MKDMKDIGSNQVLSIKGFTLLEVIIAVAVLTIGILSFYSMHVTSISGNAKANTITQVSNAARDKIEKLMRENFSDSDFSSGDHSETAMSPITSINWTVTDWDNDGISNDDDTVIDEFDERGIKSVQLIIQYSEKGVNKTSTIYFLKTEIL